MGTRPPATNHSEIIAAVAALQAEMAAMNGGVARIESKVDAMSATVNGHHEQISNWKRDGKWLASALLGLGAIGAFFAAAMRDWIMHMVTK